MTTTQIEALKKLAAAGGIARRELINGNCARKLARLGFLRAVMVSPPPGSRKGWNEIHLTDAGRAALATIRE